MDWVCVFGTLIIYNLGLLVIALLFMGFSDEEHPHQDEPGDETRKLRAIRNWREYDD